MPNKKNTKKKEEKEDKKTKKTTKKSTKKTTKKKPEKKSTKFQYKHGIILAVVLLAFSLMAIFMAQKILEPTNLSKILPSENTVGFVTVNIADLDSLPGSYAYSADSLQDAVATYLGDENMNIMTDWFGGTVGVALLSEANHEIENVYFASYTNRALAVEFLESLAGPDEDLQKTDYEGSTIYHYPLSQNFHVVFAGNYMALSENEENLYMIIDTVRGNSSSLKSSRYYNTVADNLPYNATAVTYWNIRQYPEVVESHVPIYDIVPEALISPMLSIFPSFGAAMQVKEDGVYVQTYTSVDKDLLSDNYYFNLFDKYQADLTAYLPEDATFFWGGLDLHSQFERLLEVFGEYHQSAGIILEAVLRGKVQEYFGNNIDLDEDIYPLLQGEYALAAYQNGEGEREYLWLLELIDQEDKQIHIDTLKKGFLEQQIYSEPYIRTYTLEDGSTGQEIVADLAEILDQEINYEGTEITKFYLTNDEVLGYMTVFGGNFAFATDLSSLKHSIDLMKGPNGSFSASDDMTAVDAIMQSADEASYVNLTDLRDTEFWGMDFFSAFDGVSSSKNIFDDGVATFHLLVPSQ